VVEGIAAAGRPDGAGGAAFGTAGGGVPGVPTFFAPGVGFILLSKLYCSVVWHPHAENSSPGYVFGTRGLVPLSAHLWCTEANRTV
jgi:hypothetical protein